MTMQRNLISTALMTAALAVTALPMIATAYNSAEAAGFSKQHKGKQARAKNKRRATFVKRKRGRGRANNARRVIRRKGRNVQPRRRIVRPSRPAVTMPKTVITTKPRPIARPAVTMPKNVITPKRRPFARPAVTMPKTIITTKPRPFARPAVTTPKTVITGRPRPLTRPYSRPARPAVTTPKTVIGGPTQTDPTQGRINQRQQAAKQKKYQQCASFSIRVMQGCYSQANGDPQKQKSCQRHYQGNVVRCQGLL